MKIILFNFILSKSVASNIYILYGFQFILYVYHTILWIILIVFLFFFHHTSIHSVFTLIKFATINIPVLDAENRAIVGIVMQNTQTYNFRSIPTHPHNPFSKWFVNDIFFSNTSHFVNLIFKSSQPICLILVWDTIFWFIFFSLYSSFLPFLTLSFLFGIFFIILFGVFSADAHLQDVSLYCSKCLTIHSLNEHYIKDFFFFLD